uniref:Major intrinsic protein domain containing protein n=2 Tax=Haemonchus contortus TaxID=6289 RepID=A0A7I5ECW2_HAECO
MTSESEEKEEPVFTPEILREFIHISSPLGRNALTEFFGTAMLLFIGLSVIMQLILSDEKINTWTQINFGWGLAIVFTVYLGAKTSGGHYNPAVSITMLTFGKLSFSHFIIYCIVQTAGAFVGAATAYLLYYDQFVYFDGNDHRIIGPKGTARCFCSFPDPHISNITCFVDQVLGTGLLVFFVCVVIDKRNKIPDAAHPWLFGFVLVMIGTCCGMNLGYPINPARDLGPRIFAHFIYGPEVWTFHDYYFWIPIIAPLFGGVFAGWLYHVCVGAHIPDPPEFKAIRKRRKPKPALTLSAADDTVSKERSQLDSEEA